MLQVEVKMYYSASGNDDYVLHPLKKPLTPVCDTCNDEYRKYLMKSFSRTTDMPNSEDEDICPLFVQVIHWSLEVGAVNL